MKSIGRLGRLESQMDTRALVLLEVERLRAAGGLMEYAREVATAGPRQPTVLARVKHMVEAATPRLQDDARRRVLRREQREAKFLMSLSRAPGLMILTEHRMWALAAGTCELLLDHAARQETDEDLARGLEEWLPVATVVEQTLVAPLEAARLLSERYFGGAPLLGRSEEAMVSVLLARHRVVMGRAIRVLVAMERWDGEGPSGPIQGTDDARPSAAAMRVAEECVVRARLEVAQAFDDEDRGFELAGRLLGSSVGVSRGETRREAFPSIAASSPRTQQPGRGT
jgi:hypothetical protein